MRSRKSVSISDVEVHGLAQAWLSDALRIRGGGRICTAQIVWHIVLLAAARMCSLFAACRDLSRAPSDESIRQILRTTLPKRAATLEQHLQLALCGHLPSRLTWRARRVAIDWHLIPYHGQPHSHSRELYHSHPKSGTTKFHAYATACVVDAGYRYTLAVTYVLGNESPVAVLSRLLDRVAACGVTIKCLLLDRQFFASPVLAELQSRKIPFLLPLMLRGRKARPRRGKKRCGARGLRGFRSRPVGCYRFTWTVNQLSVSFHVVVAYQNYTHHRTGRRQRKKLLYAAWRVAGGPVEIRDLYRQRFGIESSYRQLSQARIRTCTRDPLLRLFFVIVGFVLRNVWVWLHFRYFTEYEGSEPTLRLERLRFRRMLNWIAWVATQALHDGSAYHVQIDPA